MKNSTIYLLFLIYIWAAGQSTNKAQEAPKAKKIPKKLEKHGHVRIDNYYWLNDRKNPEVISYLEAENAYTNAKTKHTEAFQEKLFEELKGRIKETDMSIPYPLNGYSYYTRYEKGQEYPVYCRKKIIQASESNSKGLEKEEILLNVNQMAKGHNFYNLNGLTVSDDNQILAYVVDTVGRRKYSLHFKNLKTGQILQDHISDITGIAWANDNKTVFYGKKDAQTLRSYQIYRHTLGTHSDQDVLIYEETDETFFVELRRTKSKKYILINSSSTLSSECRFLSSSDPYGKFKIVQPREANHEYQVSHYKNKFYIHTNWKAKNFRLMETPVNATTKENWKEVISHRNDVLLEGVDIFNKYLVISERKKGLTKIFVKPWDKNTGYYLDFSEATYSAYTSANKEFNTEVLRYNYTSMTTPLSVYAYNMKNQTKKLLKQRQVPGGYNPSDYQTERLFATAKDGTKVPVSLVYKKGIKKDNNNPLLLYAYGSYGASMDPYFSSARLSLLNRGFVYAIAHIRGGSEMGRHWYEEGKMFKKKNTFTDFIACAEYLIQEKFTKPEKLFAEGGSAGGLLMGAIINMRPDLFKGVIAAVPFVDVITTMLDASIPLTTSEYDEWGNPNIKEQYDYILSYSPYDQVVAKNYPNLLVTTGLHDSQVQYWEPAKWVAKLRELKTNNNLLLLKTDMEAGHGGKTGRFQYLHDIAFKYAFLLDLLKIKG